MTDKPEERNKDSRKSAYNVEQPMDKQDPTEPVQIGWVKEGKGTTL